MKKVLVAIDYGQLEARIIAMASQDKTFCDAILTGYDVHMEWAERIAKAYPSIVNVKNVKDIDKGAWEGLRQRAKNEWVFPLFFGASPYSVSKSLGLPMDVADKLVKDFWKVFSGVSDWQKGIEKFYAKHGYVETLTGARRYGPLGYNEMINAPIQGTASYVVVDGKNRLSLKAYEENKPQYQARINVHDDLTFFIPVKTLKEDLLVIAKEMVCTPFDFVCVPLAVEISIGDNWADLEKLIVVKDKEGEICGMALKEGDKRRRLSIKGGRGPKGCSYDSLEDCLEGIDDLGFNHCGSYDTRDFEKGGKMV